MLAAPQIWNLRITHSQIWKYSFANKNILFFNYRTVYYHQEEKTLI